MKRSAFLALMLALLLILPLAWVLRSILPGGPVFPDTRHGKLVPLMSREEHGHLPSFLRECHGDEDCDAPLICLRGLPLVKPYCSASECTTSQDCNEGFSCRSFAIGPHEVRLCAVNGQVGEGEPCYALPKRQEVGCREGLSCVGGLCGRPCDPNAPRDCSQGFFCSAGGVEGPVCLPTCEGTTCPEGQQCIRLKQSASVCARVHGTECQRTPCPAEQVCDVITPPQHKAEVWMQCGIPCDKDGTPCPEDRLCIAGRCTRTCEDGRSDTCGPGQVCRERAPGKPGLCSFDF
jgi:hypothetical protein